MAVVARVSVRGPNWEPSEDKMVARAWLMVSKDGIANTDQKGDAFWEKVAAKYNELRPRSHARYSRPQNAVMKRWQLVRLAVGKFCGCVASIAQLNESGKTDEDRIEDAVELYGKLVGDRFDHLEAWRELRDEPKWKELPESRGSKCNRKRQTIDVSDQEIAGATITTTASHLASANAETRPAGVKTLKKARSLEDNNERIAVAATVMTKASQRKAEIEEKRVAVLQEHEQNRIIFARLEGLDEISKSILQLKKQQILSQLLQQAERENERIAGDEENDDSENLIDVLPDLSNATSDP